MQIKDLWDWTHFSFCLPLTIFPSIVNTCLYILLETGRVNLGWNRRRTNGAYVDWIEPFYCNSALGHPAASVPGSFTRWGLPLGFHVFGLHRDDLGVLQIAHEFGSATISLNRILKWWLKTSLNVLMLDVYNPSLQRNLLSDMLMTYHFRKVKKCW